VEFTLIKLRSLKLELRRIAIECEVDTVTIAQVRVDKFRKFPSVGLTLS
jgi:hypothetical protein